MLNIERNGLNLMTTFFCCCVIKLFCNSSIFPLLNLNILLECYGLLLVCFVRMRVRASPPPLMQWLQERIYLKCLGMAINVHQRDPHQYVFSFVFLTYLPRVAEHHISFILAKLT